MKTEHPDVLVIGLGAMGSAAVHHLARRGVRVIGVDQFTPPHTHGSTHGETRITREAIGEGQQFVPLAMRSHQLWREIESETGQALFAACGALIMARAGSTTHLHEQQDFLGNTFRAANSYGITHERLGTNDIALRFPQFILQGDEYGYFEPGAGYLDPEACLRAQLALAKRHGADLRFGETVKKIATARGQTVVETNHTHYVAGLTIVAAGPWMPQLLPRLAGSLTVRRQVMYWFERDFAPANTCSYRPRDFPVFIWHWGESADAVFYGFPEIDGSGTIKVATEQSVLSTSPDAVNRNVAESEMAAMHAKHIAEKLRGISARCAKAKTCLYTNATGGSFIIDWLPEAPGTIVVSACSGHGFKHSAAIGEALAAMAISRKTPEVLRPFAFKWP